MTKVLRGVRCVALLVVCHFSPSRPLALSPFRPLTLSPSHTRTLSPTKVYQGKGDLAQNIALHYPSEQPALQKMCEAQKTDPPCAFMAHTDAPRNGADIHDGKYVMEVYVNADFGLHWVVHRKNGGNCKHSFMDPATGLWSDAPPVGHKATGIGLEFSRSKKSYSLR